MPYPEIPNPELVSARPPHDEWPVDMMPTADAPIPPAGPPPEPWPDYDDDGDGGRPRRRTGLVAFVTALLVCAVLGGLVANALNSLLSPARPSSAPSAPSLAPSSPSPFGGSSPSPSPFGGSDGSQAPIANSGPLDTAALSARINPAVVDVNMTFDGGGEGAGTGMILNPTGEVLTNNHVVNGATTIHVQVGGTGRSYAAHVVGYDATDDVAVLQMEQASGLKTVTAAGARASIGEPVAAIGNALGRPGPPSITQGVVSGLNQSLTVSDPLGQPSDLHGMVRTTVPLQPGDSGGPLVDGAGKVVGMNTAASTGRRSAANPVGFAVPIDTALGVVRQIESGQSTATVHVGPRALLGVVLEDPARTGSTDGSARVFSVQPGGPADKAGIAPGAVITSLGNVSINTATDLTTAMDARRPGDKVALGWLDSSGRSHKATVQLTSGPAR
jgi:S1-C subfamily serine protease